MAHCIAAERQDRLRSLRTLRTPWIYGAGVYAAEVRRFLSGIGVETAGFFVDDRLHRTDALDGLPVLPLSLMQARSSVDVVVGFCCDPRAALRDCTLKLRSFAGRMEFIDCRWHDRFSAWDPAGDPGFLDGLASLEERLADPVSRCLLGEFVRAKWLWDNARLSGLWTRDHYFPLGIGEMAPRAGEVVVDGGAYTGDTLADYLWRSPEPGMYHAFEPDPENAAALVQSVAALPDPGRIRVHRMALWSGPASLSFSDRSDSTSAVGDGGGLQVPADSIDNRCPDATFIKLDLEGAELQALAGARGAIERNRPRLAVSLYHHPDHLLGVPRLLLGIHPDYRFHLRLHSPMSEELVLYAHV